MKGRKVSFRNSWLVQMMIRGWSLLSNTDLRNGFKNPCPDRLSSNWTPEAQQPHFVIVIEAKSLSDERICTDPADLVIINTWVGCFPWSQAFWTTIDHQPCVFTCMLTCLFNEDPKDSTIHPKQTTSVPWPGSILTDSLTCMTELTWRPRIPLSLHLGSAWYSPLRW